MGEPKGNARTWGGRLGGDVVLEPRAVRDIGQLGPSALAIIHSLRELFQGGPALGFEPLGA
jgi:hypothetical protein